MAISRIDGTMLQANLLRQGIDFAVETDLLYFDVGLGRIGIQTSAPSQSLEVVGGATVDNLSLTTNTLSSLNVNGDITIDPNGTGLINLSANTSFSNDLIIAESATISSTPVAGSGYLWVRNDTPNILMFTDDDGTDHAIGGVLGTGGLQAEWRFSTTTTAADPGSGRFRMNNATPASVTALYLSDFTSPGFDASTILNSLNVGDKFYIQASNDSSQFILVTLVTVTDNTGWFTVAVTVDDSGTLFSNNASCGFLIFGSGAGSGGGDVTKVGTPVNNEIGVWTGDGTIEGDTNLQWSGSTLSITGTVDTSVEMLFTERADHSFAPAATRGILWVRNDTPNTLIFTDDAGTDHDLTAAAAAPALDGLTDVTITTVADGEVLRYDSGSGDWINNTLAEAEIPRMTVAGSAPLSPVEGDFWLDDTTASEFKLHVYIDTVWEEVVNKNELDRLNGDYSLNGGAF